MERNKYDGVISKIKNQIADIEAPYVYLTNDEKEEKKEAEDAKK